MTRLERRLRRYAIFAAVHAVIVLVALAAPVSVWTGVVVAVTALPFLFSWGHFHVDLIRNGELSEVARLRWRWLLWLLPWSIAWYWFRYVRPRSEADY